MVLTEKRRIFWIKWGDYEESQQTKKKAMWSNRKHDFWQNQSLPRGAVILRGFNNKLFIISKKIIIIIFLIKLASMEKVVVKKLIKEQQVKVKMFRHNEKGKICM